MSVSYLGNVSKMAYNIMADTRNIGRIDIKAFRDINAKSSSPDLIARWMMDDLRFYVHFDSRGGMIGRW